MRGSIVATWKRWSIDDLQRYLTSTDAPYVQGIVPKTETRLTFVTVYDISTPESRSRQGHGPEASGLLGRVRCPRADLHSAPGRLQASVPRHHDRGARCSLYPGTAPAGGTPPLIGAAFREAWPEADLWDEILPLAEPRWNADRRAAPSHAFRACGEGGGGGSGRARMARHMRLRLSAFRILFSWLAEHDRDGAGRHPRRHPSKSGSQARPLPSSFVAKTATAHGESSFVIRHPPSKARAPRRAARAWEH